MMSYAILVDQGPCGSWVVSGGYRVTKLRFALRAHALAFGRALAHSTNSSLHLREVDGTISQQSKASMTYPHLLN